MWGSTARKSLGRSGPPVAKLRLDLLLVQRGLCETRARAQARILAGDVLVDDRPVTKAGTAVDEAAPIRLRGEALPFVSRGGLKLAAALDRWAIDPTGLVCFDAGSSTGGSFAGPCDASPLLMTGGTPRATVRRSDLPVSRSVSGLGDRVMTVRASWWFD